MRSTGIAVFICIPYQPIICSFAIRRNAQDADNFPSANIHSVRKALPDLMIVLIYFANFSKTPGLNLCEFWIFCFANGYDFFYVNIFFNNQHCFFATG